MPMLDSLKLTEKTPYAAFSTPEAHLRRKFLAAIDTQIAAAEAHSVNKPFIRRGKRWLPDQQTGERVLKEVPVRFLPWWWRDEAGRLMLTLRYGSKRIELKPGKPAIEVGEEGQLLPTLKLIREAVAAGELDKLLVTAKPDFYSDPRQVLEIISLRQLSVSVVVLNNPLGHNQAG